MEMIYKRLRPYLIEGKPYVICENLYLIRGNNVVLSSRYKRYPFNNDKSIIFQTVYSRGIPPIYRKRKSAYGFPMTNEKLIEVNRIMRMRVKE